MSIFTNTVMLTIIFDMVLAGVVVILSHTVSHLISKGFFLGTLVWEIVAVFGIIVVAHVIMFIVLTVFG